MRLLLPSLAPYRLRILLRTAFLLLALATVALAVSVLQQEKQLSYHNYQINFRKTRDEMSATLRHPAGQLALLNPSATAAGGTGLRPLLLPFSALDFDDQYKVQQAVAMSGCLMQYGAKGSLCAGVGNNPWAGGFIYVAGTFNSGLLVPHQRGDRVLDQAHRLLLKVTLRGQTYAWVAPFEQTGPASSATDTSSTGMHGRLTGFAAQDAGRENARPVKEFRGWIWQNPTCSKTHDGVASPADGQDCARSAFFSVRLPVAVLQDALFSKKRPVWPPADLDQIKVSVSVRAPGDGLALLDSDTDAGSPVFSLADLRPMLLPGETLTIGKAASTGQPYSLTGASGPEDGSWHLMTSLIRRLPVDEYDIPMETRETIATPLGDYDMTLKGDVRSVSKTLSAVASRVAWFVGAMLLALVVAWLVIEIGIIRRITILTARADKVAKRVKADGELAQLDLSDLRGEDELGVLASCLHDLLRRVNEDVERETIRTEQERDMWHAVGHEIMSPLQSLMVLHGSDDDTSKRYINRMQQAIRVLYGSASPSEAFQSTKLQVGETDISSFLREVADNAPCVGIEQVVFAGPETPVTVRAEAYALEDVITHVLRNADRHRTPGSEIAILLAATETAATVTIYNHGPAIAPELIDKIFEYGVSGAVDDESAAGALADGTRRGQGLFVAKTYMAKMGGTIAAHNTGDGVSFILSLQRGLG
jgi:signal transduction histidine kinase